MSQLDNFKGKQNTNGFDKRPGDILKKGRPRKLVSDVLKDLKNRGVKPVSIDEIRDIYLSLVNTDQELLKEIAEDKSTPILTKIVVKGIVGRKGFEVIERMFDRAIGKAMQETITTLKTDDNDPLRIKIEELSKKSSADKIEKKAT